MKGQPKKALLWSKGGISFDDEFAVSLKPETQIALDELFAVSDRLYDLITKCETYAEAEQIAKKALKSQMILAVSALCKQRLRQFREN